MAVVGLVTFAVALGFGAWSGLRRHVYWSRVSIVLVGPQETYRPNPLENAPPGLPALTSLVLLRLNDGPRAATSATTAATLYGEGVWLGHRLTLRNSGSQWQASFGDPIIDVEVVGPSEKWVLEEVDRIVTEARAELVDLQDAFGVSAEQRVHLSLSPFAATTVRIDSSRSRLIGATLLLYGIAVLLAIRFVRRPGEHA